MVSRGEQKEGRERELSFVCKMNKKCKITKNIYFLNLLALRNSCFQLLIF